MWINLMSEITALEEEDGEWSKEMEETMNVQGGGEAILMREGIDGGGDNC
jgi:hypothetical protein